MAKDLLDLINFGSLECLNEKPSNPATNALKQGYREDAGLTCESDTDEQLLLNIHFHQKVKLQSITIMGPADKGPKLVKLYVNRSSMGFSDADSVPCAEQFTLTAAHLEGQPLVLKPVKFNNVDLLTILVDGNQEDEETTVIHKIVLTGTAGEVFNVSEIKKVEEK